MTVTSTTGFLVATLLLVNSASSQSQFDISSKWWKKHFGSQSDPTTCDKLENPGNGSVRIVGENKAEYSCNPTYTLVGRKERACACGEWIGSIPECRKDGEWGGWEEFSSCTRTCGGGRQTRQRQCNNPKPDRGGKNCPGSNSESRVCNTESCPPECPISGTLAFNWSAHYDSPRGQPISQYCTSLNSTDVTALCVKSCPSLTHLQNGTVTLSDSDLTAQFQCDLGFVLQGSQTLLCEDGEWDGDEPQCDSAEESVQAPPFPAFADLLGSDPSIVVRQNSYVLSPAFFAPLCTTVFSFNYRMSPTVETVEIEAEMLESDIDSTIRNDSAVIARDNATITRDGSVDVNTKFFCLNVSVCVNASLLPAAAVVRTFVRFVSPSSSDILEIGSLSVNEASNCSEAAILNEEDNSDDEEDYHYDDEDDNYDYDDYEDEDENDDINCDNSTLSGDCGFTNDPCGATSFSVDLAVEGSEDDEEPIARLQQKKSTESDACSVDVCIPCLADTGVSVSAADSSVDKRRKRRSPKYQYFSARKSFCARFSKNGRYAIANSPKTPKRKFSRYLSFGYGLGRGAHNLQVEVVCFWGRGNRRSTSIKLGQDNKHFKLRFKNRHSRRGNICLKLRKQRRCNKFQIKYTADGKTKMCVNSIRFMKSVKHKYFSFFCGTVHNKL